MQKKLKTGLFLAAFLFVAIFLVSLEFTLADNDDDDENQPVITNASNSSSSKSGATKTEVTTDVSTKTTIERDGDGDGLLDPDDPHPNIPEIYVVVDDNRNGIVDKFER